MSNESRGMILGFLGVVAFGLTLPATRFIVPYFDPIFIGLGRAVIASVVAAFILIATKQSRPNRHQLMQLSVVALGVVLGFPVLTAWAMETVPASHGGVVLGVLPLATTTAAVMVSREKPSIGFWIFSLIGSIVVVSYSLLQGFGSFQLGDLLLLGAILSAGMGYALGGKLSKELGGWQVICWALVISFPFIVFPAWMQAPGVSQTQLMQPFVTLLASAFLINETVSLQTILFAVLVVCIVAIGKRMPVHSR